MMDIPDQAEQFKITRSCPVTQEILQLQEHVVLAGHWHMPRRMTLPRIMPEAVLIHCVRGGARFRLGENEFTVGPGDVLLCPPRTAHLYRTHNNEPWEIWWCHFSGTHAGQLCQLTGLSADTPVMHPGDRNRVVKHFSALVDSLEATGPDTPHKTSGLLHLLLLELHRQSAGTPLQDDLTTFADAYSTGVEDMARRAGFSKYHFCRLFKKQTGRSPWQYVQDCKMERAKELLVGSRKTIKEIAAELSFDHPDYFARFFRERCGVTPGRYRGR